MTVPKDDLAEDPDATQELRVRYNGTSDQRILMEADVSGKATTSPQTGVVMTPGSELPMAQFMAMAGDDEARAKTVLRLHSHEFEVVGDGAEDFWVESEDVGEDEFSVDMEGAE